MRGLQSSTLASSEAFGALSLNARPTGSVSVDIVRAWLEARILRWPLHLLFHRARLVDRFMDWMVACGRVPSNSLQELRHEYGQRTTTPIVRALLSADSAVELELLRPARSFGSFLDPRMKAHVELMRSGPALRPDPLQGLASHADATVVLAPSYARLERQVREAHRRPYICTEDDIRRLLETARCFPSPLSSLHPLGLYAMLVLAYCAGLRLSEIVGLTVDDVHVDEATIEIRNTKFLKYAAPSAIYV